MKNIYDCIDLWIKKIAKVQKSGQPICPYAAKAKYKIFTHEDFNSMLHKALNLDLNYDLYVCLPTNQFMSLEDAQFIEDELNRRSKDTIILLDHFKNPGFIDDVNTGNEKYVIFLIQNKNELLKARKHLHTTSYYNNWSEEYYKKIIETGT